jgi:hypothetical protein
LRDPGIYACTVDCYGRDLALTGIEVRPWRLSAARKIVEPVIRIYSSKESIYRKIRRTSGCE